METQRPPYAGLSKKRAPARRQAPCRVPYAGSTAFSDEACASQSRPKVETAPVQVVGWLPNRPAKPPTPRGRIWGRSGPASRPKAKVLEFRRLVRQQPWGAGARAQEPGARARPWPRVMARAPERRGTRAPRWSGVPALRPRPPRRRCSRHLVTFTATHRTSGVVDTQMHCRPSTRSKLGSPVAKKRNRVYGSPVTPEKVRLPSCPRKNRGSPDVPP
jgi:hypothetical protein